MAQRDPGYWRTWLVGVLRRLFLSSVGAAVLVAVGTLALFVTGWPKWLSLTIEPLSLALMPGVVLSTMFTREHDYTPREVLQGAYFCYVAALYLLLWSRDRAVQRRMRAEKQRAQATSTLRRITL